MAEPEGREAELIALLRESDLSLAAITAAMASLRVEIAQTGEALDFFALSAQEALGETLQDAAHALTDAFADLGRGTENALAQVGKALKRSVAVQLQQIADLAFARSIFELAAFFATLFLNPAEAFTHLKASVLFGAIAAGTAIAGGALAGGAAGGGAGTLGSPLAPDPDEAAGARKSLSINITNHGTMTESVAEIVVDAIRQAVDDDRLIVEGARVE